MRSWEWDDPSVTWDQAGVAWDGARPDVWIALRELRDQGRAAARSNEDAAALAVLLALEP